MGVNRWVLVKGSGFILTAVPACNVMQLLLVVHRAVHALYIVTRLSMRCPAAAALIPSLRVLAALARVAGIKAHCLQQPWQLPCHLLLHQPL